MSDHRRLQRALFRMQLDAGFARAVLAGEAQALGSTGLGEEDLALLRALEPAAIAADPGGRRREQVLGNVASEYALTLARAERDGALPGLLEGFASSAELHAALREERGLPAAFGDHALRRAAESPDVALRALARLERALVAARRHAGSPPALARGEVARSPRAHLVELPEGTLALAEALRAALDAGAPAAEAAPLGGGKELALLLAAARVSLHRLPEVAVELLSPAVAGLLQLASEPLDAPARAAYARAQGAEAEELEAFVAALVEDGVLLRG